MNNKEENSQDFCLNFVQEFGLRYSVRSLVLLGRGEVGDVTRVEWVVGVKGGGRAATPPPPQPPACWTKNTIIK